MSYILPEVWQETQNGGTFASTNRPTAGKTHEKILPQGTHAYQLYSLNTPNGIKVNIMLLELLQLGLIEGFDAFKINIMQGDQFGSDFVAINPNSKIPALVDKSGDTPIGIFESGAILLYLAQKFTVFLPQDSAQNAACLSWLMWQMGSAPFLGGGFGHFYAYAPTPIEYAINRYAMESKRQLDVLDKHLAQHEFMTDVYSIADMAIYPWYGRLCLGDLYVGNNAADTYDAGRFLQVHQYTHVIRWAKQIQQRAAVQQALHLPLQPI